MRFSTANGLLLACALAGCAGVPRMPAAFSLGDATLVSDSSEATVTIDGPAGKGGAAAAGAAKGGGAGFLIGGLACLGTGPLAPLSARPPLSPDHPFRRTTPFAGQGAGLCLAKS